MSLKITRPQSALLQQLRVAGDRGVFKAQNYTPAEMLVRDGLAKWEAKYFGGTGKLVITSAGRQFVGDR